MMAPSARTLRFAARTFVAVAGVLVFAAFFISNLKSMAGEWRRDPPGSHPAEHPLALGRQLFENRCAGCHGLDGLGGEPAPDIATRAAAQRLSRAAAAPVSGTR